MADWSELKRLAEAAQSTFGSFDPSEAEFDLMAAITPDVILALIAESERLGRSLAFTEQWYAVRLERLTDLGKAKGCWEEMAAIIANGTVSPNDPPLYARQLVRANHRAVSAERERDQLRAEVERLQNLACAVNSAMHAAGMPVDTDPAELADVIHMLQVKVAMLQKQRTELNMEAAHLVEDSDEMAADLVEARKEREQFRAERDALKHALDVKEEFYQDALHSHIVLARQRDQLRAEVEVLRGAMRVVTAEVDGNIRETVRDCVNGHHAVQDIYRHCDAIEEAICAAMGKGEQA